MQIYRVLNTFRYLENVLKDFLRN